MQQGIMDQLVPEWWTEKSAEEKKNCLRPSGTFSTGQVNHSAGIPLSCVSLIKDQTETKSPGKKQDEKMTVDDMQSLEISVCPLFWKIQY